MACILGKEAGILRPQKKSYVIMILVRLNLILKNLCLQHEADLKGEGSRGAKGHINIRIPAAGSKAQRERGLDSSDLWLWGFLAFLAPLFIVK